MPKSKTRGLSHLSESVREEEMKYLFAGLVISSVQILFMLAFTVFALCIGVTTLIGKLKPGKISD
jgi:hypothetical protein